MTPESKKQLTMQPDDQYTSQDVDQFSALISKCQQQSSVAINSDESKRSEASRHFDYTTNDDVAFDKLIQMHNGGHGEDNEDSKRVQYFTKVKTRDGYSNTDHENFTALMSFDANVAGNIESHNRTSIDKRDFSYTDQDQRNFARLNPLNHEVEGNHVSIVSEAQDILSGTSDRDVGVIKIIEYDKLKQNRLKPKDRPDENIKIRFFD